MLTKGRLVGVGVRNFISNFSKIISGEKKINLVPRNLV
jgi:hypothetical protein